ncbi:hypothetical protein Sinac_0347 [Singulisphaera acidiphila DSM 18658]|uniref:Uncharacterized protein n=1 Tax=Singulisphaera acidiphila (strain ATCC BAA-1392 / DSM 18658 / VKM B-2454 / MOB10) TaxID=886293 RepID=L0D5U8_SINAD|nr:hypothetical protein Sinac_0347 [Singulisphaera acidiphila DSM 18658]
MPSSRSSPTPAGISLSTSSGCGLVPNHFPLAHPSQGDGDLERVMLTERLEREASIGHVGVLHVVKVLPGRRAAANHPLARSQPYGERSMSRWVGRLGILAPNLSKIAGAETERSGE